LPKQWESMEVCLGMGDKPVESLWVKIRRQTSADDVAVGVC